MIRSAPNPLYDTQQRLHPSVQRSIARARTVALFLDYDGSITRIRRTPREAILSPRAQRVLLRLTKKSDVSVSIVTGRSLEQIRGLLPSLAVDIAASHGLQISQQGRTWTHPSALRCIPLLKRLHAQLDRQLRAIPGILVENKRLVITVHYRNVSTKHVRKIRNTVTEIIEPFRDRLQNTSGKKVIEIRPAVAWTKGDAIIHFLSARRRRNAFPIFVGDDRTDEDGFRVLRARGVTIRVGRAKTTCAKYFVSGVHGIHRFLEELAGGRE